MRLSEGDFAPYQGGVWRVIEGQFRSATMRIVDTDAEQAVLEQVLEASKPPVPEECRHLDYQFWLPFRYGCYPRASRFRRAGPTPGVWYGAEAPLTAICETIWGKLAFFAASPGTALPRRPIEHTAVRARIKTPFALDLTAGHMRDRGNWTDPDDYTDCLALADDARAIGGEAIRYASVRAAEPGINVAVLRCAAFAQPRPVARQTWHILLRQGLVRAHCETTRSSHMFVPGPSGLLPAA
ncbi:RES family NAD+ phosphorylase [Limimaricola sp.]|uniref:RES family NAD+ phosphorylase n=1 Tax=Limimaricola sp. TaxID=2211665 RepID=UPI0025C0B301|nr:RES family NAD+ phosphorylase [Limimaricola sp.]